jgi:hypothetical protein
MYRGERAHSLHERSRRPPRRPLNRLVGHILIVVVLPISAVAQTQQVLGNSQILNLLETNDIGMLEAFPVTASSSGKVNYLSLFVDASNTSTAISVGRYTSYDHASEHTSAPSSDSAARRWKLELSADTRGASDARKTILGRCARIEWPDSV